jgi:hypothetical protein
MGRRSRKRPGGPAPPPPPRAEAPAERPRTRRARLDEAPRSPWHPVPLSELCILLGLICLGVALFGGGRRDVLLALGIVLVGLGSLEVALREHLAGYRSHSALLALAAALAVVVPVAIATGMPRGVAGALIAGIGAGAFLGLRALFRRRSGGFGFRA